MDAYPSADAAAKAVEADPTREGDYEFYAVSGRVYLPQFYGKFDQDVQLVATQQILPTRLRDLLQQALSSDPRWPGGDADPATVAAVLLNEVAHRPATIGRIVRLFRRRC